MNLVPILHTPIDTLYHYKKAQQVAPVPISERWRLRGFPKAKQLPQ